MIPHMPKIDWLHLNWPETLFSDRDPDRRATKLERFVETVRRTKRRGARVLWTLHNEFPHDEADVDFYRGANARLCELSDLIHVHFPAAQGHLEQEYGVDPDRIHVMPHPHYGDYYGERIPKRQAREKIGVDADTRVILSLGNVRRYKGLESAIEGLSKINDDRLRLVIAGKPEDQEVADLLKDAAEGDPRLVLSLSRVPDTGIMPFFAAADAFLFASRTFFTSGSIMLALTYGLPVIAAPRNHAAIFLGASFFKPWDPPTTESLTEILRNLDDWLAGVRDEELAAIGADYEAGALCRGLSEVLAG
jgi:glycosyltransferase involved in cell wall biosynthesis